jgi:hypothetical protein
MNSSAATSVVLAVTIVVTAGCLGGAGPEDRPQTAGPTGTATPAVQTSTNGTGPSPLTVEVAVGEAAGVDASTLTVYDETTERGLQTSRDGSTMVATLRGDAGTTHDLRVTAQTTDGAVVERRLRLRITANGSVTRTPGATSTATRTDAPTATPATTTAPLTTAPPTAVTTAANAAPAADLAVAPTTASAGESVPFDGSGSTDSDGSIARYEWDRDGDGDELSRFPPGGNHPAPTSRVRPVPEP